VSFEVITNTMMFFLKDLVNFTSASASGDGKIVIFVPRPSRLLLTHMQIFYPEVESFTKNGDKFVG